MRFLTNHILWPFLQKAIGLAIRYNQYVLLVGRGNWYNKDVEKYKNPNQASESAFWFWLGAIALFLTIDIPEF